MDSETTIVDCGTCGQQHTIPTIRLFGGHVVRRALCPACAARQAEEQRGEADRAERARLDAAWNSICPPLYLKTAPARLPQAALAEVLGWSLGPRGLLLVGPTGTGKTRAVYLLLRRLLEAGVRIRAFDCAGFGHECGRRFRDGTGEDWADALAKADLVFLDDVGKVSFTERYQTELFALVERRAANMLPIIATTNMAGDDLQPRMSADRGQPLVRRLREFCHVVVFPARDLRMKSTEGTQR
jgi:DNA replication protein DnaC